MKKRIIALLVPMLSVLALSTTGMGMFVLSNNIDIDEEGIDINVDSIFVNDSIDVYLNGTEHNGSLRRGYGALIPLNPNEAHVRNSEQTKFAFDFDWNIAGFIDDLHTPTSELQWKKLSSDAGHSHSAAVEKHITHPTYLPSFGDPDGQRTTVVLPYNIRMTLTISINPLLKTCMDFYANKKQVIERPTTGSTNPSETYWGLLDSDGSTVKTGTEGMFQTTVNFGMGIDDAAVDILNPDASTAFDRSYYSKIQDVYDNYDKKTFITQDPGKNMTTVHGFFGGFEAKVKTYSLNQSKIDYVSVAETLNNMKTEAIANGSSVDTSLHVKVDRIVLDYALATVIDTTTIDQDPTLKNSDERDVNENWTNLFAEGPDNTSGSGVHWIKELYPNDNNYPASEKLNGIL